MCFRRNREANPTALPSIAPQEGRNSSANTQDPKSAASTSRPSSHQPSRPHMSEEFSMLKNYAGGHRRPESNRGNGAEQPHSDSSTKDSARTVRKMANPNIGRESRHRESRDKTESSGRRGYTTREPVSSDRHRVGSHSKQCDPGKRDSSRSRSPTKTRQSLRNRSPCRRDRGNQDVVDRKRHRTPSGGEPERKRSRNERSMNDDALRRSESKSQEKIIEVSKRDGAKDVRQNRDGNSGTSSRNSVRRNENKLKGCRSSETVESKRNVTVRTPRRSSCVEIPRNEIVSRCATPRRNKSSDASSPHHKGDTPGWRCESTRRNTPAGTPSRRIEHARKNTTDLTPSRNREDSRYENSRGEFRDRKPRRSPRKVTRKSETPNVLCERSQRERQCSGILTGTSEEEELSNEEASDTSSRREHTKVSNDADCRSRRSGGGGTKIDSHKSGLRNECSDAVEKDVSRTVAELLNASVEDARESIKLHQKIEPPDPDTGNVSRADCEATIGKVSHEDGAPSTGGTGTFRNVTMEIVQDEL